MDPATLTVLGAAGAGAKGLGDFFGEMQKAKAMKRDAKEKKRKTLAELLNAAFEREFKAGEGMRNRGTQMASNRANALQNIASQYVQALR